MTLIQGEVAKKAFNFLKENTKLWKNEFWSERLAFICPCGCGYVSLNSPSRADIKTIALDFAGYLNHLNNQIRLHASKSHIKIFEDIFGTEKTNEFLRLAIIKNKMVTNELERIYETRTNYQEMLK